jgi:hypothetical protein
MKNLNAVATNIIHLCRKYRLSHFNNVARRGDDTFSSHLTTAKCQKSHKKDNSNSPTCLVHVCSFIVESTVYREIADKVKFPT